MKNRWVVSWFVLMSLCAIVPVAAAARNKPASNQASSSTPDAAMQGVINALELNAPTPSMQLNVGNGNIVTMAVSPTATVEQDARPSSLSALRLGAQVQIRQAQENGRQVVNFIKVVSVPPGSQPVAPRALPVVVDAPVALPAEVAPVPIPTEMAEPAVPTEEAVPAPEMPSAWQTPDSLPLNPADDILDDAESMPSTAPTDMPPQDQDPSATSQDQTP